MMYVEKIPRRALDRNEYAYFINEDWPLGQPGANDRMRRKRIIRMRKKQAIQNRWRRK